MNSQIAEPVPLASIQPNRRSRLHRPPMRMAVLSPLWWLAPVMGGSVWTLAVRALGRGRPPHYNYMAGVADVHQTTVSGQGHPGVTIALTLQIKPELSQNCAVVPTYLPSRRSGIRRDAPAPVDDLIDAARRDPEWRRRPCAA